MGVYKRCLPWARNGPQEPREGAHGYSFGNLGELY